MAITNGYITLDQFGSMLGTSVTSNLIIEFAEECIETASRDIDAYCGRRFYREVAATDPPEARTFASTSTWEVFIDDAYEVPTAVAIDSADDGTYATAWTTTNYGVARVPIDAVALADRPYGSILAIGGYTYPCITRATNVTVTARWGWSAVPKPVKSACRRLAHLEYEARLAPFGASGTPETGYIRIQNDKLASGWLHSFVRTKLLVA